MGGCPNYASAEVSSCYISSVHRATMPAGETVIVPRINAQMHAWRARIVLLSANGVGPMGIRRRTGKGPECLGIGLKPRNDLCEWADIAGQTAQ